MAQSNNEYRRPARIKDNGFGINIINLAAAPSLNKEEKTRAEKGPTIGKDTVLSTDLMERDGGEVVIRAMDTPKESER